MWPKNLKSKDEYIKYNIKTVKRCCPEKDYEKTNKQRNK